LWQSAQPYSCAYAVSQEVFREGIAHMAQADDANAGFGG